MIILQALRLQSPVVCALGYFFYRDKELVKKCIYCFVDGFNLFHAVDDLRPKNNHRHNKENKSETSSGKFVA